MHCDRRRLALRSTECAALLAASSAAAQNGWVWTRREFLMTACVLACCEAIAQAEAKARPEDQRIDLNRASVDDLLKIQGMTRPWAERIVRYRPYRAKNELLTRGIVSNEIYDRIKDFVIAHRAEP